MFQNLSLLFTLIFLDYILNVVSLKLVNTTEGGAICFARVSFIFVSPQHDVYPASKVLSYFFSARRRETLHNLCIFFVEPTIQKPG